MSPALIDLLTKMICKKPKQRISIEMVRHLVRSQAGVIEWSFVDMDTMQSTDEIVGHFIRSQAGVIEWCFVDIDTLQSTDEIVAGFVRSQARVGE
jgi:hypothetical protein